MAIYCPNCAHKNADSSVVCFNCRALLQQESVTDSPVQFNGTGTDTFQPGTPTVPPPSSESTTSFVPQAPQAPQVVNTPTGPQGSNPLAFPMGYVNPNSSASSIHAFAGHGVLLTHQSWLLNEGAAAASNMLTSSVDIFRSRRILNLNIEPKNLQEHSVQTETRHYLILKRGVATVFLYIAPAGNDLYISRATTVLTSIDSFRVFILIAAAVIAFLCLITLIFAIVSIPFWLYLGWFFYRSTRYWLRERDFWVYLRKGELNDFQLDDISLLEHVADETLRVTAKNFKLDSDKIVGPTKGYEHERRIRVV